jgi:glycosyltransferase involved in cell wall biosynthesis
MVLPITWANEEDIQGGWVKLTSAIQRTGVDVTFFTLTRDRKTRIEYKNGMKIVFCPLSITFPRLPKFLSTTRFVGVTTPKGARFYLTKPPTSKSARFYPSGPPFIYKSALSLFREIKKSNPDMIHLCGFFLTNLFVLPLSKMCSIPTVIQPLDSLYRMNPVRSAVTNICLKMATKITPWEREVVRSLIHEYKIPDKKIVLVPPAFFDEREVYPMDKAVCKSQLGLNENFKYLIYAGVVYSKGFIKDPFELLHVLKELNDIERKYKLVIAGHGHLEDYIDHAKKLGVHNDVIMLGSIKPSKLNVWYNAADIFLWPYPQDVLGVGLALTEAIACGLPVVSYSGKFDSKEEENCIARVPYRDRKGMAKKVVEVMENDELRNKLVNNGLQKIKEYSLPRVAQRIKLEYERILK